MSYHKSKELSVDHPPGIVLGITWVQVGRLLGEKDEPVLLCSRNMAKSFHGQSKLGILHSDLLSRYVVQYLLRYDFCARVSGLSPTSATYSVCDIGQVSQPFCDAGPPAGWGRECSLV